MALLRLPVPLYLDLDSKHMPYTLELMLPVHHYGGRHGALAYSIVCTFELVVSNQFPYDTPGKSLVSPINISTDPVAPEFSTPPTVFLAEPCVIHMASAMDDNSTW